MTFPNLDKAVLFYKEYARIAGFVVRLATSNSSDGIITIKYSMFVDNLSDKIKTCPGYSFEYFLDEEGILTRLFWADVISRRDNTIFGDVVSFDATYRMNKYNLVFVPFTGVDNQLRSVTLAAGLISKEDVDSYTWLLTCFKKLSKREPSVIVTDQDASMKTAIATIFPSSRHRFCMWHITEKLQSKVGISKYRESGFLYSIKAVIWDEYNDCKEFEEAWRDLITKYNLHANIWLAAMYDLRSSWILVYFRDVHMGALLRTTSRSESGNLFFGSAMDLQRQNRVQLYLESRSSVPTLNSTQKLEKHASETFSYPVFKKIQSEMSDSAYGCAIQSINEDETGRMYIINDAGRNSKLFQVTFTEMEGRLKCRFMKFKSYGYICRHLFKVVFFLRYEKIHDYVVMGRWHIDASRKHNPGMFLVDHENLNQTREQITLATEIRFHVNVSICSFKNDVDSIRKFHDHIYEYVKEHAPSGGALCSATKADYFWAILQMPQPADVVVNNPGLSRNKGCGKRIRGPVKLPSRN
ncbi:hypothetical protein QQ045_018310 [Rhodiola kirilowii]